MRHRVAGKKLNMNKGHQKNLRRTLMRQLFEHERIQTTRAKAQAIRSEAEKLITLAKKGVAAEDAVVMMNARRLAASRLGNAPETVKKLFDDIGPRYAARNGGYTRIFKLGMRQGDAAEMVQLELVEE